MAEGLNRFRIRSEHSRWSAQVLDAAGKLLTPGLIDQHVHITGGGGEGSFHTRTPELQLSELVKNGITTVVGLLGTDGITRSVDNLYAKTRALCEEGVSAYMLTGAYGYPSPTITGEIERDIVFVKEVLGVKLAISDHRAPNVTEDELIQIASKARVAGMLSGKPGMVTLHMGDDKAGIEAGIPALRESSVPVRIFRPTHVNRNDVLLEEGYQLLEKGGYVDLTCCMHTTRVTVFWKQRSADFPQSISPSALTDTEAGPTMRRMVHFWRLAYPAWTRFEKRFCIW